MKHVGYPRHSKDEPKVFETACRPGSDAHFQCIFWAIQPCLLKETVRQISVESRSRVNGQSMNSDRCQHRTDTNDQVLILNDARQI
jgi:hypothetical protein